MDSRPVPKKAPPVRIILTVEIRYENDVVMARQQARQIAHLLGFEGQDQTRIATAVSEICRNAFQYAGGGRVEYGVEIDARPQKFAVRIIDQGPGITDIPAILEGRYQSRTGLGLGIIGARRLMDEFRIKSDKNNGTIVFMTKNLPSESSKVTSPDLLKINDELARLEPQTPFGEIRRQNMEMIQMLEELRQKGKNLEKEIAERRRVEEALLAKNEELKAFAYTVSHDLKAPLRGIAGYASELEKRHRQNLSERAQFCLAQIQTATSNLDHLIEDLLHYSRLERETPSLSEVNPVSLVAAILKDRSGLIADDFPYGLDPRSGTGRNYLP